jgi:hypothetical protein
MMYPSTQPSPRLRQPQQVQSWVFTAELDEASGRAREKIYYE